MTRSDATDGSTVVAGLRAALDGSRARTAARAGAETIRDSWHTLRGWLTTARVTGIAGSARDGLGTARRSSTLGRRTGSLSAPVRGSLLYRWLTAEPDPEVVVIDLRETYAVGPVIALLDRLTEALARRYRESAVWQLASGIGALGAAIGETRVGQAIARVLAPPDPPARPADADAEDDQPDTSDDPD